MTRHRQALNEVIGKLQQDNPQCALLLAGSLLQGTEHADSDIDLFGVVPELPQLKTHFGEVIHSTAQVSVVQAQLDGIPVTITICDASLLEDMVREPWRNHLFAQAGILSDPLGVAGKAQGDINAWFAAHPDVERLWTNQQRKHAECKSARRQGRETSLEFPTWDAFADHVDRVVRQGALPQEGEDSPDRE